jgi:hypothetical protein
MALTKVTYSMIEGATANILDFGASPSNSAADNTTAINAAIQAANSIYIPSGVFTTNFITLRSGVSIYGAGPSSILSFPAGQSGLYGLSSGAGSYLEDITLSNFKLLGAVAASGFSEFVHLINVNGVRNLLIDGVQFVGFQGDGLYLGAHSDNTRHNINVSVTNCLFDGVNKDNRNGISAIDCDGLKVSGCSFKRLTRSNMPGPIDIEPNVNANTVRNISVIGNSFEDTDAAVGVFSVAVVGKTLTVDPTNFTFSNNIVNATQRMVTFLVDGTYTSNHNLNVIGNTSVGTGGGGQFYPKLHGGCFSNNIIRGGTLFGFSAGDSIKDLSIIGNTFDGASVTDRAFNLRDGSGITISGNTFSNYTTYGFLCGISGGTLSNVSITGNTFVNVSTYAVGSAGGTDGSTCTYMNNTSAVTHQFPAWRTDDTGNITNGDTSPTTFNADNLPSEFARQGIFRSTINGDTAVPNTSGRQGLLETHCEAGQNGRKWKYQVYWPANNTTNVKSFYLRKAANATDTWETWAEVVGV